ncbi:MAG: hypothetical protein CMN78_04900 [Spirochaetales bacterium]|nr:hypothetical protein [Spirochaetales bacterium]
MKRFRFKLERILSLRAYREREWELKLGMATGKCVRLSREIDDRTYLKARAALRGMKKQPQMADLLQNHLYLARIDQEIGHRNAELAEREKERKEVQAGYLDASKDRKVLSNLKDKLSEAYSKKQKLEEVKEIDDINTGRAARKLPGSFGAEE